MTTKEIKRRGRPVGYNDEIKQRMQCIIDFVRDYSNRNKIAPTLSEIAVGIGMKPTDFGNIAPWVDHLVEQGFLTRVGRHVGRSLAVASKPPRKRFYVPPDAP